MMLSVPRPETLARVETKKIIAFHGKYDAERVKFRQAMEKMVTEVANFDDKQTVKDYLEQKKREIGNALKDQESTMSELGADVNQSYRGL
jgi:DNA-binding IscR family transcriptional regulator